MASSGIDTRRPLVLQLHKSDDGSREYAEFLHLPRKRFTDFAAVRKEIQDETDRETGRTKQISSVPIHLSIYSPNVVNLTLVDLPGLTKVAVEGQPESIVQDIENMVRSYIEKPSCIILAISPANQDLATSDAIKNSREFMIVLCDPWAGFQFILLCKRTVVICKLFNVLWLHISVFLIHNIDINLSGERTLGVLTKIDLMDKGTDAVDILEGKSYRLKFPWVGVVNRSQADINKNVDMIAARRREREYFASTPEYRHLANRMGSEHLAKVLSKHSMLLDSVLHSLYLVLTLSNRFVSQHLETVIKSRIPGIQSLINKTIIELETELSRLGRSIAADAGRTSGWGVRSGGEKVYNVFDSQLPAALKRLQFDRQLSMENIKKFITEADGYQPHLIAPEQGYRRLIESTIVTIRGPAEAAVDAVHSILKDLVHKAINETPLSSFESFLKILRKEAALHNQYLTDTNDSYLRRIGTTVLSYVNMVCGPKSIVYCQQKRFSGLLNEDPAVMERRSALAKRLELYRSAQAEIDTVAWSK
ncbi:hypothetical protein V6N13_116585 [Hibiscus sabdariffa]